jgi:hypothetical protein
VVIALVIGFDDLPIYVRPFDGGIGGESDAKHRGKFTAMDLFSEPDYECQLFFC